MQRLATKQKFFGTADPVTDKEFQALGVDTAGMAPNERSAFRYRNVSATPTGEFRKPRKGEWYLSGAIPCAYKAHGDFSSEYFIAHLVLTRTETRTITVPF